MTRQVFPPARSRQDHPGRALVACETAATRALAALHELDTLCVGRTDVRRYESCMAALISDLQRIVDLAHGRILP